MSSLNRLATAVGTAAVMIGGIHTSACSNGSSSRDHAVPSSSSGSGATGSGSGGSGATTGMVDGSSGVTTGIAAGGSAMLPPGTDPVSLIPARIRRLTNAEYDASVSALLGTSDAPAERFAPDARQNGFTVNDAQRVDPVLAKQLVSAAEALAAEARQNFDTLAPCDGGDPESCAQSFIANFGAEVYRRPLVIEEAEGLLEVYRAGALDATYEDGIELVIRALLQSAGFLYLTELGSGVGSDGTLALTAYELAASLSYLFTESPPSQELITAALNGELDTAEARVAHAEALSNSGNRARNRFVRIVHEWLALDRIDDTAKDTNIYPEFASLKPAMSDESYDFTARVVLSEMDGQVNSVAALLGADYTVADSTIGEFYGSSGSGPYSETIASPRLGLLNQGAFLAVHAHAHESTPVLRGIIIARRVACLEIPSPASLNVEVIPPVPDPSLTTRERFSVHTADPECAQCHNSIDSFGNAFEQFDGMGKHRDTENGMTVDSSTTINLGLDFDGDYADSNELAAALATSPTVLECFARHAFRAAVGRSGDTMVESENYFAEQWKTLSGDPRGNLKQVLTTYVASALFTHRRAP